MRRSILLFIAVVLLVAACSAGFDSGGSTTIVTTTTMAPTSTTSMATTTTTNAEASTTVVNTTTTTVEGPDVVIEGGTVESPEIIVNGPDAFEYSVGDEVAITVLSSVDDEIHVHGYGHRFDAMAGEMTLVTFPADVLGIFEVELEGGHLRLFVIEVAP